MIASIAPEDISAPWRQYKQSETPLQGGAWKSTREDAPASNHKSVPEEASQGRDVGELNGCGSCNSQLFENRRHETDGYFDALGVAAGNLLGVPGACGGVSRRLRCQA